MFTKKLPSQMSYAGAVSTNTLLDAESALAHTVAEDMQKQRYEEKCVWMRHYQTTLQYMYTLLEKSLQKENIRVHLSLDEFRNYVYHNTERYFVPHLHKKVRLLS